MFGSTCGLLDLPRRHEIVSDFHGDVEASRGRDLFVDERCRSTHPPGGLE